MNFEEQLSKRVEQVNTSLLEALPERGEKPARLHDAIRHSSETGGKRLRPVLVTAAHDLFPSGLDPIPAALAIECIHTYSLIHDDLIDDDIERRGCETPWKKYGKNKALLLGDLLIAKSLTVSSSIRTSPSIKADWALEISNCITCAVRGAFNELDFESNSFDDIIANYTDMSRDKTGVMFALPARCVAIASKENQICLSAITEIFTNLAIAYQIRDDQADYLGIKNGRKNLSDLKNNRPNLYHLLENAMSDEGSKEEFIENFQKDLIARALGLAKIHIPEMSDFFSGVIIPFITLNSLVPSSNKLLGYS